MTLLADQIKSNQMISYLATHVGPHLLCFWLYQLAELNQRNRIVDCPLGHEVAANPDVVYPVLA